MHGGGDYREEYGLDDAVVLDVDGRRVHGWDADSNEAVLED